MARAKRDAAATKERLMDAAARVFVERGYDGARVDEIAATAKVNKRMMYLYYGSKQDMYQAVIRAQFERFEQETRDALVDTSDPAEQVRAIITSYFDYLAANPGFVRLLGWETLSLARHESEALVEWSARGVRSLERVLERGVQRGLFRPDLDIRRLILSVSALCLTFFNHRIGIQQLWGQDMNLRAVQRETLDHILNLVFQGIGA